jgi:thiol-disulfide isomerase/thioredoxin
MVWSRLFVRTALVMLLVGGGVAPAAAETVLMDFTQAGCGPCEQMEPTLRELAREVRIQRVDVRRDPQTALQHRVDATPTFLVLVDGREWARVTGYTQHRVMVEMIQHAQELAAQDAAARAARTAQRRAATPTIRVGDAAPSTMMAGGGVPAQAVATSPAAAGPQDGRLVAIQDPFAVRIPQRAAGGAAPGAYGAGATPPAADAPGAEAPAAFAARSDAAHLIAATVRLSVVDANGRSTGTGSIVDARNGRALVITCGHIFRESKGQGPIQISLFAAGPNGAELRETVAGELIDYDLDRDLALVRFDATSPVAVAPIAPAGTRLAPGAAATCVGCNHGENPTAWATSIKTVNRYQGHPNVEAAGAPVEGRSGGGLFNDRGQLIGVCFAADHDGDEGLYSSIDSIHEKLDELHFTAVYQSPSTGGAAAAPTPAAVAAAGGATPSAATLGGDPPGAGGDDALVLRGQNPAAGAIPESWPGASSPRVAGPAAGVAGAAVGSGVDAASLAALSREELATLEEIARRSGGAEVICIIRPQSPDGRSEVIKLSGASPAFVRALAAAAAAGDTGVAAAAGGAVRR